MEISDPQTEGYYTRVIRTCGIIAAFVLITLFFVYTINVLLLLFAGILLAVLFNAIRRQFCRFFSFSDRASFVAAIILITSILNIVFWFVVPGLLSQVEELSTRLPQATKKLQESLGQYKILRAIFGTMPDPSVLFVSKKSLLTNITGYASYALEILLNVFVVTFICLYIAFEPKYYINGLVKLFPLPRRDRIREVIYKAGETLEGWLEGQVITMGIVWVLTTVTLWLFGLPLAFTLGLIAALVNFIPHFGPLLAVIPAALIALLVSPSKALMIVGVYLVIQLFEGYVVTPLIQRKTVDLPPLLTITSQLILGVFAGGLGIALATPFLAVVYDLIKYLYVEDTLGDISG